MCNQLKRAMRYVCAIIWVGIVGISVFLGGRIVGIQNNYLRKVQAEEADCIDISKYLECPEESVQNSDVNPQSATTRMPVCSNWMVPAKIHDEGSVPELVRSGASFASKYDPRDVNGVSMVTPVRDQGMNETCWAFATVAAMECNLIKKGLADATLDLSENQFAYFFYHRQADSLGNTKGDYNSIVYKNDGSWPKTWNTNGGTLRGSGMAIATWAGLTTEERSPYLSQPNNNLCYAHEYSARNVIFYNYDVTKGKLRDSVYKIKQAVSDYGAVASGMYIDELYLDQDTGAYYCNRTGGNHAVTIVGWDDNYSRENFLLFKPSKNGAWIVKNSYGTDGTYSGDEGYIYISYEDASLAEMMAIDTVPLEDQYTNNYQYDGTANPMMSIGLANGVKCANIFKAKASSTYSEELKAVGICTLSTDTNYEIQVYTGVADKSKPTSGTKVFSSAIKGSFSDAGYHTVPLPKTVALVPGEHFSIVVTIKKAAGIPYIAVDMTTQAEWIKFQANVSAGESFLYLNKRWYDLSRVTDGNSKISANVRIKAYTDTTAVKPSIKLTSTKLGVSKDGSVTLKLKKKPLNIMRGVTWKSANKKIATVSSKGKIKGKSYGKTTVTATFIKGSKKATLKCMVTVGPTTIKDFSVLSKKGKITIKWKKNMTVSGCEVLYATAKNGSFKKLVAVKGQKSKISKKLNSGTYYVKMRAYKMSGKTKLYGSDTSVKMVTVQ